MRRELGLLGWREPGRTPSGTLQTPSWPGTLNPGRGPHPPGKQRASGGGSSFWSAGRPSSSPGTQGTRGAGQRCASAPGAVAFQSEADLQLPGRHRLPAYYLPAPQAGKRLWAQPVPGQPGQHGNAGGRKDWRGVGSVLVPGEWSCGSPRVRPGSLQRVDDAPTQGTQDLRRGWEAGSWWMLTARSPDEVVLDLGSTRP